MLDDLRSRLRTFAWQRGLRAMLAVGSAMVVCHWLGRPPGAAALGAFNALLVDNGGPYRVRLRTMATMLLGGGLALIVGAMVPQPLAIAVAATMLVCFGLTFARVLSQPFASSSVLILVLYFAGLGGTQHSFAGALISAAMVLLGGLWAAGLSLVLWPLDPFRPARRAVAGCYLALAEFTAQMLRAGGELSLSGDAATREASLRTAHEWRHQQRVRMEAARTALSATAARAPSRTIRARNLTVLLETSDMLFARLIRVTEMADLARATALGSSLDAERRLSALASWLAGAEHAVYRALEHRPADRAASFARDGSQWMESITRRRAELGGHAPIADSPLLEHLRTEERDALLEMEIAFDAVRAIWTGAEARRPMLPDRVQRATGLGWIDSGVEALSANWTMRSAQLRHALRLMMVGAVDVIVMRLIHVNHGFWLPMTSIILLQPYSAGTARRSVQRVTGTVAGGVLAAVLAVGVPGQFSMIAVVTLLATLAVATFAVDYALYSFFLTPTFVLLSLPRAHDWRYAGVRMGTTLAGALIAILAMRLLWPERAEEELGRLLRRGAEACAEYLRALERFWATPEGSRREAERELLAPARRLCGLTSNDAEEAVDRVMQEPHFGRHAEQELRLRDEALTFATYLRRLTQSITTLAFVGQQTPGVKLRLRRVGGRLEQIAQMESKVLQRVADDAEEGKEEVPDGLNELAEEQMLRIERQADVLTRAAAGWSRDGAAS